MMLPRNQATASRVARGFAVLRDQGIVALLRRVRTSLTVRADSGIVRIFVRIDARRSIAKLRRRRARGLFVDCGSNLGQGFAYFSRHFSAKYYDYILIEPNPNCVVELQKLAYSHSGSLEIIAQAASTRVDQVSFFGLSEDSRGKTTDGGSIVKGHNSQFYSADEARAIQVQTFSLSDLLRERARGYSSVIMKLDVEGAEYDVLEDLIERGTCDLVDVLYVEFHSRFMAEPDRSQYRNRELKIIESFKARDRRLRLWD